MENKRLTEKHNHWFNNKEFNYCINNKIDFEKDIDKNQDEKDYLLAVQTKELHFITDKLGQLEDLMEKYKIESIEELEDTIKAKKALELAFGKHKR